MPQGTPPSFAMVVFAALIAPAAAHAITLGQVDDFQNGGAANWTASDNPPATNVSTGGPAGAGDRYLRTTSGGTPSHQLGAFNYGQWAGDYVAAGVTAVDMDLCNFGSVGLDMRLAFNTNYGQFTSTVAALIPPDGAWHHVVFGLDAGSLTLVDGVGDLPQALRYMGGFKVRHQSGTPLPLWSITPIESQLGVDNIRAIPEPATLALMALGAAMLRRRRRSLPHAVSSRIGGVL